MAGSDQAVARELALHPAQKRGEDVLMGFAFFQILVGQGVFRVIPGDEMDTMSDVTKFATAYEPFGAGSHVPLEQREFQAGRAGVENQDGIAHDVTRVIPQRLACGAALSPYGHVQSLICGMSSPCWRT